MDPAGAVLVPETRMPPGAMGPPIMGAFGRSPPAAQKASIAAARIPKPIRKDFTMVDLLGYLCTIPDGLIIVKLHEKMLSLFNVLGQAFFK